MSKDKAPKDAAATQKASTAKPPKAAKTKSPKVKRKTARAAAPPRLVGPLAPWRFPLSVGGGLAISVIPLVEAVQQDAFNSVVLNGLLFGCLIWFATGRVDAILARAQQRADEEARQLELDERSLDLT